MNGFVAGRRGRAGFVAAALAHAERFLLEAPERDNEWPAPSAPRPPVVAVVALAPRCGTTTVARGLAAALAARAEARVGMVCGPCGGVSLAIATAPAARLSKAVADQIDVAARVSGRLCLIDCDPRIARAQALRNEVPLVIAVPTGWDPSESTSLADAIVLVAGGSTEPALATVVGASLARSGPEPLVVVSRPEEGTAWDDRPAWQLADSRLGSRIALAGREPPGSFGALLVELAERCLGTVE
jgi:hypothetical protein